MEEVKKYEFRKLMATDIFTMSKIISALGVNKFSSCFQSEGVKKLITDNKKNDSIVVGIEVFTEMAQVIFEGLDKCETHIYKLLSDTSNLSIEDIKTLDAVTFFEMIIDFCKKEEFMGFFKAASKLLNKEN